MHRTCWFLLTVTACRSGFEGVLLSDGLPAEEIDAEVDEELLPPDELPIGAGCVERGANLVGNPSFDEDASGWAVYMDSTLQRVPSTLDGGSALEVAGPAVVSQFGVNDVGSWVTNVPAAGTRYCVSSWVRSSGDAGLATLRVREYVGSVRQGDAAYAPLLALSPSWQRLALDYVAIAAGSRLDLQILDRYPVRESEVFQVDAVSITVLD